MKKRIWVGSIALALLLVGCSEDKNESAESKDDIETQEEVNEKKLEEAKTPTVGLAKVGEQDNMQLLEYEVANTTKKDIEIVHSSQQLVEFTITDEKGEVAYRFSESWNIDKPEEQTTLVPANSKTLFSLPLPGHLEPGTYTIDVYVLTDSEHKAKATIEYDAYHAELPAVKSGDEEKENSPDDEITDESGEKQANLKGGKTHEKP